MSRFNSLIRGPEDLRGLSLQELDEVVVEIRQSILSTCLTNGGHLGASLGAVELTVALHSVFESPKDSLVWDVGHQAYAHKMICGRWENFGTLRKLGGVAGFLRRSESPHDVFGGGHSSTALSAALAIAWKNGEKGQMRGRANSALAAHWTVAIVGDAGLTAGLAFEAMNHFRTPGLGPLLVVLNDNQMSISGNVGSLFEIFKEGGAPRYFDMFGFEYVGPVDGHNLGTLIESLRVIRQTDSGKPVLFHIRTQKGKGYPPAEEKPTAYHGVAPMQLDSVSSKVKKNSKSYSQIFGEVLCELAESDQRIVAITAAMTEGTGLRDFARKYPDRFFDVGIAESHAVTFAAGLAAQGMKPFVAIYSTFLQRGIDSIIHDVALQNLPVTFAIDRAGIVGQDGPTHHGVFDLSYLGMVPHLTVAAPSCYEDLRRLLKQSIHSDGPLAIRYPRGEGFEDLNLELTNFVRWHQRAEFPRIIAIGLGSAALRVVEAVHLIDPKGDHISCLSTIQAKPISSELLKILSNHPQAQILCVEDGMVYGGFGQALWAAMGMQLRSAGIVILGYGDHFIEHGSTSELENLEGVSVSALCDRLQAMLNFKKLY